MAARDAAASGEESAEELRWIVETCVEAEPGIRLQYVDLFDPVTFAARERVDGRGILAAAAYVGDTRLIDNIDVVSAVPRRPSRRRIRTSPAEVGGR
jgi:pantothenate synthetase